MLSPKADVLAAIEVGEFLALKLKETDRPPILAVTRTGKIAGTIVPVSFDLLILCMASGVEFGAEVIAKTAGACKVRIRPKGE